jgi:hypothetical protein
MINTQNYNNNNKLEQSFDFAQAEYDYFKILAKNADKLNIISSRLSHSKLINLLDKLNYE